MNKQRCGRSNRNTKYGGIKVKKNKMTLRVILMVLLIVVMPSVVHAGRVIGITFGSGLSFPMGDLADKDKYQAKLGTRATFGIDIYPIQRLSVGPFVNADFYNPDKLDFTDENWHETLPVTDIGVAEFGCAMRYFLITGSKWQPYIKMWMGHSYLFINTKKGGTNSEGAFAWGLGGGVMFLLGQHIGFSGDVLYNQSKTDAKDGDTTNRINLGIALNLLIG
jgi:hypothetical protein